MSSRFNRPKYNDDDREINESYEARVNAARFNDNLDLRFGYSKHAELTEKIGWMVNMQPAEIIDEEKRLVSAMDYYFIQGLHNICILYSSFAYFIQGSHTICILYSRFAYYFEVFSTFAIILGKYLVVAHILLTCP